MRIGFHIGINGGLENTIREALARRCQTLQVFTAAPVQWRSRKLDPAEDAAFVAARERYDLRPLFVHAPYLLNVASPDKRLRKMSVRRLIQDLHVAHVWQAEGVVLHLGSGGEDMPLSEALPRVAAALREALAESAPPTRLILENCAGQGNLVGRSLREIGEIMALADDERLALCLDTAHAFAAGYAIHTQTGLDELLAELEEHIGLSRLCLIHANDSLGALGSNRDRHWHIGQGQIGPEGWRVILSHERLRDLPFIMETPKGEGPETLAADLCNLRALRLCIPPEIRPLLPPRRRRHEETSI